MQVSSLPHLVGGLPRHVHQAGVHGGGGHHGLGARYVAGSVVDEDQGLVLGVAVALAQEHRGLGAGGQQLPARGLGLGPGPRLHPEAAEGGLERGPGLGREAACNGTAFTGELRYFPFYHQ